MPIWRFISFQDAISPIIEHLMFFHDHVILTLIIIIILILYLVISLTKIRLFNRLIYEGQEIETIWTLTPAFILIIIALPSIKVLYMIEEIKNKSFILKTIGHQWYWSYENTLTNLEADSFLTENHHIRLLKTTENINIPANLISQVIVSSEDVIHSWTIPRMGVKVDAVPGRLNQTFLIPKQIGIFTGQCSEICGANHSFIPIFISRIPIK
jgi:cytochrome c oxidase subunit 2